MVDAALVTVHGFWSDPATWDGLRARWQEDEDLRGLQIHPFSYSSPRKPRLPLSGTRIPNLDDIAQILAVEYATVLENVSSVAFVTHSQGGLVLQRFLAWMVNEGRAQELVRIRTIVMLACPNSGSQYLASIRRVLGYGRHPQAADLEVLNKQVADTQRAVLARIVNAPEVGARIPFHVYAAGSDAIVPAASAQASFPGAGTLAGNHFTILDPASPGNRTAETVKHHLLRDLPDSPVLTSKQILASPSALSGSSAFPLVAESSTLRSDDPDFLPSLAHDLATDVDMFADSPEEVEDLARRLAQAHDDADLSNLLQQVATALAGDTGQVIRRRLIWFGRQLLRSADKRLIEWPLEEAVKDAPQGMAVLLTDPAVWAGCPAGARRRCLTALLGSPDQSRAVEPPAIQLLAPLLHAGILGGDESNRVEASFNLTALDRLIANGVTLEMIVPRILADLDSSDFNDQNRAAWFLCKLSPAVRDQSLPQDLDFSLGAKLTHRATGGRGSTSWGAQDAMKWNYVSTWPSARLAGGVWAAVSWFDGQHLRAPASEHLSTLIAAAHGTNLLKEILEFVRDKLDQSLERGPDGPVRAAYDVQELARAYTGSDQQYLTAFGDWLRSRCAE